MVHASARRKIRSGFVGGRAGVSCLAALFWLLALHEIPSVAWKSPVNVEASTTPTAPEGKIRRNSAV